jgi:hypothetical protein
MKIHLCIEKSGSELYKGTYDIYDADSFGRACADAWEKLREQRFAKATSIGALIDALDERLLDELNGAKIAVSRA